MLSYIHAESTVVRPSFTTVQAHVSVWMIPPVWHLKEDLHASISMTPTRQVLADHAFAGLCDKFFDEHRPVHRVPIGRLDGTRRFQRRTASSVVWLLTVQ